MVQEDIDFVINKIRQGTEPVSPRAALFSPQAPEQGWQLAVHLIQALIPRVREGKFLSALAGSVQAPAGWLPTAE